MARILKITPASVHCWPDIVPPRRQLELEAITRGKLRAGLEGKGPPPGQMLPLRFGQFHSDTISWTGHEMALAVLLMAYAWEFGPLPVEPERLAQLARWPIKDFEKAWVLVSREFIETPDGLEVRRFQPSRDRAA